MNFCKWGGAALAAVLVVGCGGGSDTAAGDAYTFVAPPASSSWTYTDTTVDDAGNIIHGTSRNTVASVSADGSYAFVHDDPTHSSITINGTVYATPTQAISDNRSGQDLSSSYTAANGNLVSCTYSPHGAGPDYPVSAGQSWTLSYAVTCGSSNKFSFAQTGVVIGVDSVTVPAGTYSAVKLQSTLTSTDAAGTTRTETITTWRDVVTSVVVERLTNIAYSGTPLVAGHPVTVTSQLQSHS